MTRRGYLLPLALLALALLWDLWALFGPAPCPACRGRRTVGDRIRGGHRCDWAAAP